MRAECWPQEWAKIRGGGKYGMFRAVSSGPERAAAALAAATRNDSGSYSAAAGALAGLPSSAPNMCFA
jgi:hypothetical protein